MSDDSKRPPGQTFEGWLEHRLGAIDNKLNLIGKTLEHDAENAAEYRERQEKRDRAQSKEIAELKGRVESLEKSRERQKGWAAGLTVAGAGGGALLAKAATWLGIGGGGGH